ncbi:tetratricopeptide repeat protein [Lysobacter olei]
MPSNIPQDVLARWMLLAGLALTAVLYWPGLSGPFLYDDLPNLRPVLGWFGQQASWEQVVLGNASGPLGRPVAMLTFLFSADLHWMEPWGFKLDNLMIHLLCAALIWRVALALFSADHRLAPQAHWLALAAGLAWALHPIHVSTVLYVIQRMTQLSTLFALAAILAYLLARKALADGQQVKARLGFFLYFPVLWLLAMGSKETAIVTPMIVFALEATHPQRLARPHWERTAFFLVFLALPITAGLLYLAGAGAGHLAGYEVRDFTMMDRLLTQPHAVATYLRQLILPDVQAMGLYTDDFPISHTLFAASQPLASIALLLAITVGAFLTRKSIPTVLAGWSIFVLGLLTESTVFALDMYYEHRTYFPSLGIIIAIVGGVGTLLATRPDQRHLAKAGAVIAAIAVLATFALLTHGRANTWSNRADIVLLGVRHHPDSIRAKMDLVDLRLRQGSPEAALAVVRDVLASGTPREQLLARTAVLVVRCQSKQPVNAGDFAKLLTPAIDRITTHEPQVLSTLASKVISGECDGADPEALAAVLAALIDNANAQPEHVPTKTRLHLTSAQLYEAAGNPSSAQTHALKAWNAQPGLEAGLVLARSYVALGMAEEADKVLAGTSRYIDPKNSLQKKRFKEVKDSLSPASLSTPSPGN